MLNSVLTLKSGLHFLSGENVVLGQEVKIKLAIDGSNMDQFLKSQTIFKLWVPS